MKLKTIQVQNYRCVEDSDPFEVSDVTCLVGKNEAGKSALLNAIHVLNPDDASSKFDPLRDYPRRKFAEYKPTHEKSPAPVLTTVWELTPGEITTLNGKLSPVVVESEVANITKGFDNILRAKLDIDEAKLISSFIEEASLSESDLSRVSTAGTVPELWGLLTSPPELTPPLAQLREAVSKLAPAGRLDVGLGAMVAPLLPKFLYFADYEKLSGQIAIDDFLARRGNPGSLKPGERIFGALLDFVGINPQDLRNAGRFDALIAELEAVSSNLSNEVFEYWTQNESLKVLFDYRPALPHDPPPFNAGWVFRTRVQNKLHDVTVSFDDRSSGFIWFFSFLVWFSQLQRLNGDRIIVLLDEPGLTLHGKAQSDLLRFINERLRPHHQVLYSTHSPFMVDLDNIAGIRTVEDRSTEVDPAGTKVSSEILSSDKDTRFPLLAAIGYDVTQSLFVGKNTLVVEGPSDLVYLKWASNELRASAGGLDPRWVVAPTGGIDKIWSFVALFGGNALNVSVLSDFHSGDKRKVRELRESKLLPRDHVFTADSYSGKAEADTEDLLGREFYFALSNRAYGLSPTEQLKPAGAEGERVVKLLEDHFNDLRGRVANVPTVDHYVPAIWLMEHPADARALPDFKGALERFRKLFLDINQTIPNP